MRSPPAAPDESCFIRAESLGWIIGLPHGPQTGGGRQGLSRNPVGRYRRRVVVIGQLASSVGEFVNRLQGGTNDARLILTRHRLRNYWGASFRGRA